MHEYALQEEHGSIGTAEHEVVETAEGAPRSPDQGRGVTIFGELTRIVDRLRALEIPLTQIEFLPNCEWALYVKPGVITPEQGDALRHDFQVASGRC